MGLLQAARRPRPGHRAADRIDRLDAMHALERQRDFVRGGDAAPHQAGQTAGKVATGCPAAWHAARTRATSSVLPGRTMACASARTAIRPADSACAHLFTGEDVRRSDDGNEFFDQHGVGFGLFNDSGNGSRVPAPEPGDGDAGGADGRSRTARPARPLFAVQHLQCDEDRDRGIVHADLERNGCRLRHRQAERTGTASPIASETRLNVMHASAGTTKYCSSEWPTLAMPIATTNASSTIDAAGQAARPVEPGAAGRDARASRSGPAG